MPKILIAIPACWKHMERMEAQRDTWMKEVPSEVDIRFFLGIGGNRNYPKSDEVFLKVEDDYDHLFNKVKAMCQWAAERDYSHLFKCDTDTWVYPHQLTETSNFGMFDYIGMEGRRATGRYAVGGAGYWLSRRAFEIIAKSNPVTPEWAHRIPEDVTVGTLLRANGINLHVDARYYYRGFLQQLLTECELTPDEMRERYIPKQIESQDIARATGVRFANPA